jgi:tetratricopeptide (TPR) repeat protein
VLRRILICAALFLAGAPVARADATTVLVFPFEHLSNDRTMDWLGEGISELIIGRLKPEPGVYTHSREERIAVYERLSIPEASVLSRATALKLGWAAGVDQVVAGSFSESPGRIQIVARLIDMEAGSGTEFKAEGKLEDVIPLTNTLAWQLLKKIVPGTASPESDYTARPPTPRSAFENYVRGILNPDVQKRIDLLQNAVRLHPQYAPALFQLGRAFHLQGDFTASNECLSKIPEPAPDRSQVQFLMGLNYFQLGDYARAAAILHQLPQSYDVLLTLGAVLSRKGDTQAAVSAWQSAAGMDPLTSDAFFNMGYASFVKGDFEAAARNLDASLRLRGRDSEALYLLGRTYQKQGRPEDGERLIAQATRLSERVERWLNQPLPKLERFATVTTFRSHNETWNDQRLARRTKGEDLMGWLDTIQGDIDSHQFGDALRELRDLMRLFPDSPEARSLLAEVSRQQDPK